ncbi:MAG: hypothetical protein LBS35_06115 [Synergistaceae bacterium]|nr:hypothetical protein [Synergistaceae bacterium]
MSKFEFVSCRLAIQVCIGHFPDGRERHRTFSVKNIRPDADDDALIAVVRAIGSLLAYPVTHARLIVKSRRVLFDAKPGTDRGEGGGAQTQSVFAKSAAYFVSTRPSKTKQKVSGRFRSLRGLKAFAAISSYFSTLKKSSRNLLESAVSLLQLRLTVL